jgi:cell division protein FtsZ
MVFIASGMGGGTGTGAAPGVARTAKELGALTVGVVTKPFFFEGKNRMRLAEQGIAELRKEVDAIIIIPNDRILATISKETTAKSAFAICDEVLKQAVEGISDLITTPGFINIDFADIRSVLQNAGSALMGVGTGSGEKRAEDAAKAAISSPLLDLSIHGAKGVLFSIAGGNDLTMYEIQDAAKIITESVDPEARVIFGTIQDDRLQKGEVRVTVVAAGFPELESKNSIFQTGPAQQTLTPAPVAVEDDKKGKIFNGLMTPKEKEVPQIQVKEIKDTPTKPVDDKKLPQIDDADDDWGAVPAFLRRSKIK